MEHYDGNNMGTLLQQAMERSQDESAKRQKVVDMLKDAKGLSRTTGEFAILNALEYLLTDE